MVILFMVLRAEAVESLFISFSTFLLLLMNNINKDIITKVTTHTMTIPAITPPDNPLDFFFIY